ncbi:MAG: hypothetical protein JWM21_1166 [Acidobacteria bacterium]|nr:hypothetical protein [Acidobacteriota bacterium]
MNKDPEEVWIMNNDYLWDRTGEPDAEVQQLEDVLETLRYQPLPFELPAAVKPAHRSWLVPALAIAAAIAFMILAGGIWLRLQQQSRSNRRDLAKVSRESRTTRPAAPDSPVVENVSAPDRDPDGPAAQRNSLPRRNRMVRISNRNQFPRLRNEMSATERVEAEAAKDQLMLALRVVSAKLNLAQRKTQSIPATNNIRNQHKLG